MRLNMLFILCCFCLRVSSHSFRKKNHHFNVLCSNTTLSYLIRLTVRAQRTGAIVLESPGTNHIQGYEWNKPICVSWEGSSSWCISRWDTTLPSVTSRRRCDGSTDSFQDSSCDTRHSYVHLSRCFWSSMFVNRVRRVVILVSLFHCFFFVCNHQNSHHTRA